ncbi:unnamed protein product [Paramecium sonneborni]|uniref:Uncharacterized protein n=1 Tax=Paramecium sonneborni TaxID=65129 RepID=A0A8S1QBG7_9CILI|nr:unnamed protein product [Paramecium sonneborni]
MYQILKNQSYYIMNLNQLIDVEFIEIMNRIKSLINKNLVCISAISFVVINQIPLEVDLTNVVMVRFQGNVSNFENSILNLIIFIISKSIKCELKQRYIFQMIFKKIDHLFNLCNKNMELLMLQKVIIKDRILLVVRLLNKQIQVIFQILNLDWEFQEWLNRFNNIIIGKQ